MEINAELFKQYYQVVEQKLKEVSKLKYCPKGYAYFDCIKIEDNTIYLIVGCVDGYYETELLPDYFLSKSLEELEQIFEEKYGEIERRKQQKDKEYQEEQERKLYERLKAKFEK